MVYSVKSSAKTFPLNFQEQNFQKLKCYQNLHMAKAGAMV